MGKKPTKKPAKTLNRKQMKKTVGGATLQPYGGFQGGVRVAVGDVNGDGTSLKQNLTIGG